MIRSGLEDVDRVFDDFDLKVNREFIKKDGLKKFKADNFDDEVMEFDVDSVSTSDLAKVVATLIKSLR